jgi:Tetratricopeptide repeat
VVHTLVSRTVRYRYGGEERTEVLRLAALEGLRRLAERVWDIRRRAEMNREIVHARHLLSGGVSKLQEVNIAVLVGIHDYEQGDYAGARQLQEQVLAGRRRLLSEEHPDTLGAMDNLAADAD